MISVIGSGNVACHLVNAMSRIGDVIPVEPRTLAGLPVKSEICLIAVKDDAIEEVAEKIAGRAEIVAHTSGSIPMDILDGSADKIGVFYPMQTFSKDVPLDYSTIPFFIEGNTRTTVESLYALAKKISPDVYLADGDLRKRLHLAAVFACNFTNRLIADADEILKVSGLDYTILLPLIRQTINKLEHTHPLKAQTGPAVRNDISVMNRHLDMIDSDPYLSLIYKTISNRIFKAKQNECD